MPSSPQAYSRGDVIPTAVTRGAFRSWRAMWPLLAIFFLPAALRAGAAAEISLTPVGTISGESVDYVTFGPDQNIWATGQTPGEILKIGGVTGIVLARFPLSGSLEPLQITPGPDGNVWFTAFGPGPDNSTVSVIGKITPQGAISTFPVPTVSAFNIFNSGPIVSSSDGFLYAEDSNHNIVLKVDPTTHVITEIPLTPAGAEPGDLLALPDGSIDVILSSAGLLARIVHGQVTETPISNGGFLAGISLCTLPGGPGVCITNSDFTHGNENFVDLCSFGGNCTPIELPAGSCFVREIACSGSECLVTMPQCPGLLYVDISNIQQDAFAPTLWPGPAGFDPNQVKVQETPFGWMEALTAFDAVSGDSRGFVGLSLKNPCANGPVFVDGTNQDLAPPRYEVVGSSVDFGYQLNGGTPPITFSQTGELPPGVEPVTDEPHALECDGRLTVPGEYEFTLIATDANGCTASVTFDVIVYEPRSAADIDATIARAFSNVGGRP